MQENKIICPKDTLDVMCGIAVHLIGHINKHKILLKVFILYAEVFFQNLPLPVMIMCHLCVSAPPASEHTTLKNKV